MDRLKLVDKTTAVRFIIEPAPGFINFSTMFAAIIIMFSTMLADLVGYTLL